MVDFVESRYEGDEGSATVVVLARVTQDVLNFSVAGVGNNRGSTRDVTVPIHVFCNASRSGNGIHARGLFITWIEPPPSGYQEDGKLFIPCMRFFLYRAAKLHERCTYLGKDCIVIGKRPEVTR